MADRHRRRRPLVAQIQNNGEKMPLNERAVLVAFASYADSDNVCWPSVGTVADCLKVSARVVYKHLASLRSKGYLVPVGEKASPRGKPVVVYRVVPKPVMGVMLSADLKPEQAFTLSGPDNLNESAPKPEQTGSHNLNESSYGSTKEVPRKSQQELSATPPTTPVKSFAEVAMKTTQILSSFAETPEDILASFLDRKVTPGNLSLFWRKYVGAVYPKLGCAPEFPIHHQKNLHRVLSQYETNPYRALSTVLGDWPGFSGWLEKNTTAFDVPAIPSVGLFVKYGSEAALWLNFRASEASEVVTLPFPTTKTVQAPVGAPTSHGVDSEYADRVGLRYVQRFGDFPKDTGHLWDPKTFAFRWDKLLSERRARRLANA